MCYAFVVYLGKLLASHKVKSTNVVIEIAEPMKIPDVIFCNMTLFLVKNFAVKLITKVTVVIETIK